MGRPSKKHYVNTTGWTVLVNKESLDMLESMPLERRQRALRRVICMYRDIALYQACQAEAVRLIARIMVK